MALSDDLQLQIYIIIGVSSFFIGALILAVSILSYYLVKLYRRYKQENNYLWKRVEHAYKSSNVYSNSALDLDDELNRRYTMHRSIDNSDPPPPSTTNKLESFGTNEMRNKKSKTNELSNVVKGKPSIIDVSEEFGWRQNVDGESRYNSGSSRTNMEKHFSISPYESRTAFN